MPNYKAKGMILSKVKDVDTTITSDSTVNDDPELVGIIPVGDFTVICCILLKSHATPNFKYTITGEGNITGQYTAGAVSGEIPSATIACGTDNSMGTDDTVQQVTIIAQIQCTVSEELKFKWAQSTSNANDTIVKAGSSMLVFSHI